MAPSSNDDSSPFLVGAILFMVAGMIVMTIYALFSFGAQRGNDKTVVDQVLPNLVSVVHYPPDQAERILAPNWKAMQSVSPVTLAAAPGGTSVRWQRIGTDGCEVMKRFFAQYPAHAAHLQIVQNGVALAPSAYGDMSCWTSNKYDDFTFEFLPR